MLRDWSCSTSACLAVLCLAPTSPAWAAEWTPHPAAPVAGQELAAELVQAALTAEIVGREAERPSLLRRALEAAPDYAPAHWHSGHVRIDGQWLTIAEATSRQPPVELLEQYSRRARRAGRNVAEQLKLADWCRDAGLPQHERIHLAKVLALQPKHAEAGPRLEKLQLAAQDERAKRAVAERNRAKSATEVWKTELQTFLTEFSSEEAARRAAAVEKLQTITDPAAIPALEALLSTRGADTALLVVKVLRNMPEQSATASLARHAVLSNSPEVRVAAARALKERSLYGYVPLLLDGLNAPIEIQASTYTLFGGALAARIELFQEGPRGDKSIVSTSHLKPNVYFKPVPVPVPDESSTNVVQPGRVLAGAAISNDRETPRSSSLPALGNATAIAGQVARHNAKAQFYNERIAQVLSTATGMTESTDPRALWKWWYDYNELYYPAYKPVEEQAYDRVATYRTSIGVNVPYVYDPTPPPPPPRTRSCFLAGTKVWTVRGTRAIETIVPGDSVLAQDIETGELSFKPVLATTVRPPSPILTVNLGREAVGITRGHPLWVVGAGWRMAKELRVDERLHTLDGPVAIESIDKSPEAEAYNLVVADFHTYFIGDLKVLVHDNEMREPTDATLPGFVSEMAP